MVGDNETEGSDRPSLALSGNQDALVEAVAAANPHTVVVVKSGGPVLMPWADQVPAIVEAWYPGEEDGNVVAAVLFGDVNPSGKLPISFPQGERRRAGAHAAAVPRRQRNGRLFRGIAGRLPVVRRAEHRAAVPVRVRPVVHERSRSAT